MKTSKKQKTLSGRGFLRREFPRPTAEKLDSGGKFLSTGKFGEGRDSAGNKKSAKGTAQILPSLRAAAAAHNVSVEILRLAKASNCPGFNGNGTVTWSKVEPWLLEHEAELKEKAANSKAYWEIEKLKWNAKKAQRQFEAEDGLYWKKADVTAAIRAIGEKQKTMLLSKCRNELAPKMEGLSAVQRIEVLEQFAQEICAVYQQGVKQYV